MVVVEEAGEEVHLAVGRLVIERAEPTCTLAGNSCRPRPQVLPNFEGISLPVVIAWLVSVVDPRTTILDRLLQTCFRVQLAGSPGCYLSSCC